MTYPAKEPIWSYLRWLWTEVEHHWILLIPTLCSIVYYRMVMKNAVQHYASWRVQNSVLVEISLCLTVFGKSGCRVTTSHCPSRRSATCQNRCVSSNGKQKCLPDVMPSVICWCVSWYNCISINDREVVSNVLWMVTAFLPYCSLISFYLTSLLLFFLFFFYPFLHNSVPFQSDYV